MKEKTRPATNRCFICGKDRHEGMVELPGPAGSSVIVCSHHHGIPVTESQSDDDDGNQSES